MTTYRDPAAIEPDRPLPSHPWEVAPVCPQCKAYFSVRLLDFTVPRTESQYACDRRLHEGCGYRWRTPFPMPFRRHLAVPSRPRFRLKPLPIVLTWLMGLLAVVSIVLTLFR
jgi:hypothetical protein